MFRFVKSLVLAVGAAGLALGIAVPAASAAPAHYKINPVISVTVGPFAQETTASPVVVGEVLQGFGPYTRQVTITSVKPDGPVFLIVLADNVPLNTVLDFHVVSRPIP